MRNVHNPYPATVCSPDQLPDALQKSCVKLLPANDSLSLDNRGFFTFSVLCLLIHSLFSSVCREMKFVNPFFHSFSITHNRSACSFTVTESTTFQFRLWQRSGIIQLSARQIQKPSDLLLSSPSADRKRHRNHKQIRNHFQFKRSSASFRKTFCNRKSQPAAAVRTALISSGKAFRKINLRI